MSELSIKQRQFAEMLPLLYLFIVQRGFKFTLGDAYRDKRCPYGHPQSLHRFRLAQDINLFLPDGTYLQETEDHKVIGAFWESIGGSWGGRFNDGNHYSLSYRGMR
jgi:hypothetical protein